ncbi:hypothetical protein KBY86_02790 [Synechococcus sp. Lug-A]|uniref:hypothetical protein n=1 Tax=Synechococcus sp. Lug-A TaxID=2823740 RepID=UPI0020CCAFD6|nr:hypothetical protein [Synechococcus sp. Lug-A]MCP9845823.1 hypothetical protein [Synechococcus sp. Lug-A]
MPPSPSATYQRLREYTSKPMRINPHDQPLVLMELLGRRTPISGSVNVLVGFSVIRS